MSAIPSGRGRRTVAVAALILLCLSITAGLRPLMLPDEGRYVGVAWEMLRSGDWLTPTLNGLPFFHKPPLFYWITAASLQLFGPHEWAARAAPLLGAAGGAWVLYLFLRRWWSERAARLGLIALLAQPLFFVGGQFANLDMLVAGCISATIVLAADAVLRIERGLPYRRALAGAYALAALGVLAKGLIGLVIPALVIGAWLLVLRRWRVLLRLLWWPGLLLFAVLAMPWFLAMQWRYPGFLDYFFVVQHFKRFAAGGFNNVQPFWFYPAVLLLLSLPWLPWLYRSIRPQVADANANADADGHATLRLLMWLWLVVVLLFFSLPQSKLLGYILPAVPPLAVLMADGFLRLGSPSLRARRLWWASAALTSVLSLGLIVGLSLRTPNSLRELSLSLKTQRGAGEPLIMLGGYYYDLPFYAQLMAPSSVMDDWHSDAALLRDNWRKELADAGQFSAAQAQRLLIAPAQLPAALCGAPVSWVIGPAEASAEQPFLTPAQARYRVRDTVLWRVDTRVPGVLNRLGCEGRPNADSASK